MPDSSPVSIFVPVLVLVVIEISQTARDFDLVEIAKKKQEPFFYGVFYLLDSSEQGYVRIPQLGPFNFIHGMNLGILFLGYLLVVTTSSGSTRVITALIVWLFWVLFPILEVAEYVELMDTSDSEPFSFLFHAIMTTVAAAVIFGYGIGIERWIILNLFSIGGFVLLVLAIFYTSLFGYLSLLERELEAVKAT